MNHRLQEIEKKFHNNEYIMNDNGIGELAEDFRWLIEEAKEAQHASEVLWKCSHRLQSYRKVLQFYADNRNYEPFRKEDEDRTDAFNLIDLDQGQSAQNVLKEVRLGERDSTT